MHDGDQSFSFARSRLLHENASKVIPGGVNSNVRFWESPHPIFIESGEGLPTIFNLMFTEQTEVRNHEEVLATDRDGRVAFLPHLMAAGISISGHGNIFISDAHTGPVIDETLERFDRAVGAFVAAA